MSDTKSTNGLKKFMRAIRNYCSANYGADDSTHRPVKNTETLRKMVKKENLEDQYINNKDLS